MKLIDAPTNPTVTVTDVTADPTTTTEARAVSVAATAHSNASSTRVGGLSLSWKRAGNDRLVARWEIRS